MNRYPRTEDVPGSPIESRAPDGRPSRNGEATTSISALVPVLWRELPALLDDVGRALRSIEREYADFLAEQRLIVTAAAHVAIRELIETAEQRLTEPPGRLDDKNPDPPVAEPEDEDGVALV